MAKNKDINIKFGRRIETQRHAAIPTRLFEVLFRTAAQLAMEGDQKAAQWFFDELAVLDTEATRKKYNGLRWKGLGANYYGLPCVNCGKTSDTIDHIVPLSKGGTNDPSNLQPMCWDCNRKKSNR